jgi:hypothetical protein
MAASRAAEYESLRAEAYVAASHGDAERARVVRRLRAELRRVSRRDFFPPAERDAAVAAIELLAASASAAGSTDADVVRP